MPCGSCVGASSFFTEPETCRQMERWKPGKSSVDEIAAFHRRSKPSKSQVHASIPTAPSGFFGLCLALLASFSLARPQL